MAEPRKWKKYYNLPEIERIRKLIKDSYSNKLQFIEESHQYFLDGVEFTCVSDMVAKWSSVDEEAMLDNCAQKAMNPRYPNYKYHGMTKEEIKAQWDEIKNKACTFGTSVHAFGESMFYYMSGQDDKILPECKDKFDENGPKPSCPQEEAIVKFWNDIPESIIPVLAETKVFNTNTAPYAGTFDILFYYYNEKNLEKNGLILGDYKTNYSLSNDYARSIGQMMNYPFNDLYEESLSHYYLQLSFYQYPMEQLGLKVIGRRLIHVKDDGTYDKVKVPNMVGRIKEALDIKDDISEF